MFQDLESGTRNLVLPLILLFTVPGCVYIINKEPTTTTVCRGDYIPPPIPGVPVLTASDLKDHNKSDDILVDKIKELRDYAAELQKAYKEHNRLVIEQCSKS